MSIFNLPATNEGLKPIQPQHFPDPQKWETKFLSSRQMFAYLKGDSHLKRYPLYHVDRLKRIGCIAMMIALSLIAVFPLCLRHYFKDMCHFSLHSFLPAILVPTILVLGGACVLFRLTRKVDILAGTAIHPFKPRAWAPMHIITGNTAYVTPQLRSYVDLSTLHSDRSGIGLVYSLPTDPCMRAQIFVLSLIALPWVTICRMVYNFIRFFVAPFYILVQMIMQCCARNQGEIKQEDRFVCLDIVREAARSLCNCIKAPFYYTAYLSSLLYSLMDPLAGRVMISAIERDWNDDVIRSRSVWIFHKQKFFQFEGEGARLGLGQHGHYLMGCAQPDTLLLFDRGEIVSVAGPTTQWLKTTKAVRLPTVKVISQDKMMRPTISLGKSFVHARKD